MAKVVSIMKKHRNTASLAFQKTPYAMPVAGRVLPSVGGAAALLKLVELADEWSKKTGASIVAVLAGDGIAAIDAGTTLDVVVGLRVYWAGTGEDDDGHKPTGPLTRELFESKIATARDLPAEFWGAVELTGTGRVDALLSSQPVALHFVATGPQAGGYFGFGVLGDEPVEGLEIRRGTDETGEDWGPGIIGVPCADLERRYEGGGWIDAKRATIDMSPDAHATRVARTGGLAGDRGYYFCARRSP